MTGYRKDEEVVRRLRAPSTYSERNATSTDLVRWHYDEIESAHKLARCGGKTWAEIGRDLRPTSPILAGTVARAFARITAERARNGDGGSRIARASAKSTSLIDASTTTDDDARKIHRNPFAHIVDPIRLNKSQEF